MEMKESIYKKGDKVRIIPKLEKGMYEYAFGFERQMLEYLGREATIMEVKVCPIYTFYAEDMLDENHIYEYKLDVDNGLWCWSAGMFEGLVEN